MEPILFKLAAMIGILVVFCHREEVSRGVSGGRLSGESVRAQGSAARPLSEPERDLASCVSGAAGKRSSVIAFSFLLKPATVGSSQSEGGGPEGMASM